MHYVYNAFEPFAIQVYFGISFYSIFHYLAPCKNIDTYKATDLQNRHEDQWRFIRGGGQIPSLKYINWQFGIWQGL